MVARRIIPFVFQNPSHLSKVRYYYTYKMIEAGSSLSRTSSEIDALTWEYMQEINVTDFELMKIYFLEQFKEGTEGLSLSHLKKIFPWLTYGALEVILEKLCEEQYLSWENWKYYLLYDCIEELEDSFNDIIENLVEPFCLWLDTNDCENNFESA